ncbi:MULTISPECIES: nitroreductase family protein [Gemella]|uniref:nitroreductase family protein n=1 Tax=Gemella TaxID=1378 RepID=UPI00076820DC|nr:MULTISPECIES: nitroreductase family protein [Gemella]AME09810.1 NADPH-dependent oxidoreductase [Gemella sp. oral taxon 928]AXI25950.1 NADPH-dependent oxidoreductase [Gemella sp. ND 6198]AXI27408.1 NADPH-dependent oxidoreductase [Gemella sp. ND 6198]
MNATIELLKNHRTHRHFIKGKHIPIEELTAIVDSARQAPSWMNGQHYSIVVVDDEKIKTEIAEVSGVNKNHIYNSGAFLIFYADFNNIKLACELEGVNFNIENSYEALITATTDAALAMQNAVISAESLGYGTVCCGGIRFVSKKISKILNVPENSFMVCGLSIGVVDTKLNVEKIKPRLPKDANVGYNAFPTSNKELIGEYVNTMIKFAEARETKTWTKKFADFYGAKPLEMVTQEVLKEQKFIK